MNVVLHLRPKAEAAACVRSAGEDRRRPKAAQPLATWRLRRAVAYVEANLSKPVRLADMANAAGLSEMHFAAQFRAATGHRPREYLLRRRIERACALLAGSERSLVDIALSVGFQSQAHFSTVFRRFVGDAPWRWRQSNWNEAAQLSWHSESDPAFAEDRACARTKLPPSMRSEA